MDRTPPSDLLMTTTRVAWKTSLTTSVSAFVTYSYFFEDRLNGEKNGQMGSFTVIGGNVAAAPSSTLGLMVGLKYLFPQKSKTLVDGMLQTESQNSRRKILSSEVNVLYASSKTLTLKLTGDLRYYFESERTDQKTGLPYSGKRVRYNFGPGFSYAWKPNISCQAVATYMILDEEQDIERGADKTTTGLNVDFGVRYTF